MARHRTPNARTTLVATWRLRVLLKWGSIENHHQSIPVVSITPCNSDKKYSLSLILTLKSIPPLTCRSFPRIAPTSFASPYFLFPGFGVCATSAPGVLSFSGLFQYDHRYCQGCQTFHQGTLEAAHQCDLVGLPQDQHQSGPGSWPVLAGRNEKNHEILARNYREIGAKKYAKKYIFV